MKFTILATVTFLLWSVGSRESASADDYAWPGSNNYSYHSSTAGEGYARGMGDVIRSEGVYNALSSQAAINMTEARRRQIENQAQWTDTYFRMREINREARAQEKRPQPTQEDWIRYAQMGRPARLGPTELDAVSGLIRWPSLLATADFASYRAELDPLFAERAQTGVIDGEGMKKAQTVTKAMLASLKDQITQVSANEYTRARKFIESIAYEASLPKS
jgi:hypothetical protein